MSNPVPFYSSIVHEINPYPIAGVQPAYPRGVAAGVADLEGVGAAARGPRRPDEAGQDVPALHREGLQERDAGQHLPRDSQVQPGIGRPAGWLSTFTDSKILYFYLIPIFY